MIDKLNTNRDGQCFTYKKRLIKLRLAIKMFQFFIAFGSGENASVKADSDRFVFRWNGEHISG